jgi:hypothetical protein
MGRQMPNSKPKKPTPLFWTAASVGGFVLTLVAVLFLTRSHAAAQLGAGPIYFVVLVILGCSAALQLFGALRGFANYTGHILSGSLEISGPIAVAALTVLGGYVFRSDATRPIVVRVLGPESQLVCPESVQLELGQDIRTGELGTSSCQVQFNEVPAKFFAAPSFVVRVKADGYEPLFATKSEISSDGVIEVRLRRVREHSTAWGRVVNADGASVAGASILIDGQQYGTTGDSGLFRFDVPFRGGRSVQFTAVMANGRVIYDDRVTLPIAATLQSRVK